MSDTGRGQGFGVVAGVHAHEQHAKLTDSQEFLVLLVRVSVDSCCVHLPCYDHQDQTTRVIRLRLIHLLGKRLQQIFQLGIGQGGGKGHEPLLEGLHTSHLNVATHGPAQEGHHAHLLQVFEDAGIGHDGVDLLVQQLLLRVSFDHASQFRFVLLELLERSGSKLSMTLQGFGKLFDQGLFGPLDLFFVIALAELLHLGSQYPGFGNHARHTFLDLSQRTLRDGNRRSEGSSCWLQLSKLRTDLDHLDYFGLIGSLGLFDLFKISQGKSRIRGGSRPICRRGGEHILIDLCSIR